MAVEDRQQLVRRLGFKGTKQEEYAKWLGTRHRERVWGEFFSNAMVTAVQIILRFQEQEDRFERRTVEKREQEREVDK